MTFESGDIDSITQVTAYVNITNDITSGEIHQPSTTYVAYTALAPGRKLLLTMQNRMMFEFFYRLLNFCIIEVGFLSLFLVCVQVCLVLEEDSSTCPLPLLLPHMSGDIPLG